jgi:hypothetical protein
LFGPNTHLPSSLRRPVPNTLRWCSVVGCWFSAVGCWLPAGGCWCS